MGIDHLQYVQQRRDPNQDLVVINIPVDQWDALPALAKKKVQQSREFVSDNSCIRRLIITTKDDIANLPPEITGHCCSEKTARERVEEGEPDPFAGPNPAFRREDGYEGYKYLLKIFRATACAIMISVNCARPSIASNTTPRCCAPITCTTSPTPD